MEPAKDTDGAGRRRWLRMALAFATDCLKTGPEQAFERELNARPVTDDETFYQSHYGGSQLPKQIPIQLRRLFATQLGEPWMRILPGDKPADVYLDLDFAELVLDAQDEFGVSISTEELSDLDGSFDSLVRCIAGKLPAPPTP
jgi:acyl carrier protein